MRRGWIWVAASVVLIGSLGALTAILDRVTPATDPSPAGYRVAAQYFRAGQGQVGRGLNLLVADPGSRASVVELRNRLRRGIDALVVLQSPAELADFMRSPQLRRAGTYARVLWPDPSTAGVRSVQLGGGAFALVQKTWPPLLATPEGAAMMTRLPVGSGTLWLVSDPGFFTNAEIGAPGHLGILANLVAAAGGRLNFATWPRPPWRLALPNPGRLNSALLYLVPGLVVLFWALGARFGAVRRTGQPDRLATDDREALSWMMRRRQAGRLALQTLLEEQRDALSPTLQREIGYRIAQGPVSGRELRAWQRRIAENGGRRIG